MLEIESVGAIRTLGWRSGDNFDVNLYSNEVKTHASWLMDFGAKCNAYGPMRTDEVSKIVAP